MRANLILEGEKELRRLLKELPKAVERKVERRALTKASAPLQKSMKAKVPVETRTLKKAVARKVKAYKRNRTTVAIVGAKKQVKGDGAKRKEVKNPSNRVPSRYLHLVEKGTKAHAIRQPKMNRVVWHPGSKGTGAVSGAYRETKAQAEKILIEELRNGIETEAAKLGKR